MKGNYPVNEDQATFLGTMKLISEYGCFSKNRGQLPKINAKCNI